jgi:hypothetical protein
MTEYNNTEIYTSLPIVQSKIHDENNNHIGYRVSVSYKNEATGQISVRSKDIAVTPEQKEIFKNDISIFQEFVSAKIFEHNLIHYCNLDLTPASEG